MSNVISGQYFDIKSIPAGTRQIIVFDTNAYRELTFDLSLEESRAKVFKLRQSELKSGVFALANPFVIWELVGHLGNKADPAFNYCLNSLVMLAEHTWSPFDPSGGICLFADAESAVCLQLFQNVPPLAVQNVQSLSRLASHVKEFAPNLDHPALITNLKIFAAEMENKEKQWLADMQQVKKMCCTAISNNASVDGNTDKTARQKFRTYIANGDFMDAWANLMVNRYANVLGIILTPEELKDKTKMVQYLFPVSFYLMAELLKKFQNAQSMNLASPKKKRGNFLWDAAICFTVGSYHEIDGAPIRLVTGDIAIRNAAIAANCPDRVLTLSTYLNTIGFS